MYGGDGRHHQIRVIVEDPYKKFRKQVQKQPGNGGIDDAGGRCELDRGPHPSVLFRTVVKSHDGLGAVGQAVYQHGDDLADGVYDCHDAYIQIASIKLQAGVAHDLHAAVGDGHGEAGQAEPDDFSHPACFQPETGRF